MPADIGALARVFPVLRRVTSIGELAEATVTDPNLVRRRAFSALRTLVGWNVEIMFMFGLAGIVWFKTLGPDPGARILGLPDRWFWAIGFSAFAVLVEHALNGGGLLVWDYRWWNRGLPAAIPIFFFGYLWFFVAAKFAIERRSLRAKLTVPAVLFGFAVALNLVGLGALGMTY